MLAFTIVLSLGQSQLAIAAVSPTEQSCPHLPPATSTDPADALSADVIDGPPVTYRPYELAAFPNTKWTKTRKPKGAFSAKSVTSYGAAPAAQVRIPTELITLPDRTIVATQSKLVPACDYYKELNGWESYVNALGHTLRDTTKRYHVKENIITSADEATWDAQTALNTAVTDITPHGQGVAIEVDQDIENRYGELFGAPGLTQAQTNQQQALGIVNFNANNQGTLNTGERLHSYRDSHLCTPREFGWKKTFYVKLDCNFEINYWDPNARAYYDNGVSKGGNYPNQSQYSTKVEGGVSAEGTVFNLLEINFLESSILARTFPDGSASAKISGKIMGFDGFSGSAGDLKRDPTRLDDSDDVPIASLEKHINILVAVGPIPVVLQVGARGSGSIHYTYGLAGLKASGKIEPTIEIEGFASAGVSLLITGVKVEAALTILDEAIGARGHVDVHGQGQNMEIIAKASLYDQFETLSGGINLVLWIYVPRFGWVPWKKKEFEHTLFHWDGLRSSGALYTVDDNKLIYQ